MKVLLIEDEVRAANQLQRLLDELDFDHVLLGVIDSVEDGVRWFRENPLPDLVFMDIQLADGLSFEIFDKVALRCPIIFTTAFDQYAIQAFKVNSIDYLLKPIQKGDLGNALDQFMRTQQQFIPDPESLQALLDRLVPKNQRQGILVREGNGFAHLGTADLLYAYSEEGVTFGITAAKRVLIDETLDQLFPTLDSTRFFRINRSQIVNRAAILKIEKYFNHRLLLKVTRGNEQEFIVSRPKTSDFKNWLNR